MTRNSQEDRYGGLGRRKYLKAAGIAAAVGLAGCSGGGGGNEGGGGGTSTPTEGGGGGSTDSGTVNGGSGGSGPITLGHLNPFSGGLGWIGSNATPAVKTAKAAIEDAGGVLDGRGIEFNRQDTQTSPQSALSGFETLAAAGVPAIVGPSSSVMPNLVEPIQSEKVPVITVMAGTIQLDGVGGEWLWRNVPSDAVGGRASGRYAYKENGAETMALAYKNDKGSQSFSAAVGDYFEGLGGEVVKETPLAINANSYRSELNTLIDAEPDIVQMTAGTEVTSLFVKNYTQLGAGQKFNLLLGNDVLTQSFIEKMGTDVMEGMLGQAPAEGPHDGEFTDHQQEVTGKKPGVFAATAYDAVIQFALAFHAHGAVERQAIPEQLPYVSNPPGKKVFSFAEAKKELDNGNNIDYVGAANPQNFSKKGNVLGPFSVVQAKGGSWEPIETYSADSLAPASGFDIIKA